jgi:ubiquitin-conjugating enzyme E2 variant
MQRLIDVAAAGAFALLALWAAWRLAACVDSPARCVLVALCAILGWIVADFLSGLVHWAGDSWGSIRTPFIGPWFIRPFREHHSDPQAMTRHAFIETNGASCLASLPPLAVAALLPVEGHASAFAQSLLFFTALGMLVANQCHKWAHADPARLGPLVRGAQRLRLVLSPEHHRLHHAQPFDSHYCTASGWMNIPLNAIGFFRVLEYVIGKTCGAVPRNPETQ